MEAEARLGNFQNPFDRSGRHHGSSRGLRRDAGPCRVALYRRIQIAIAAPGDSRIPAIEFLQRPGKVAIMRVSVQARASQKPQ